MKHSQRNGPGKDQIDCMTTRESTPVNTHARFMDADKRALSHRHTNPIIGHLSNGKEPD